MQRIKVSKNESSEEEGKDWVGRGSKKGRGSFKKRGNSMYRRKE